MDEVEAIRPVEQYKGTVECMTCGYWGAMDGYVQPTQPRYIEFVCPECKSIETVTNPSSL